MNRFPRHCKVGAEVEGIGEQRKMRTFRTWNLYRRHKKYSGFTLIELLVVIGIISFLMAFLVLVALKLAASAKQKAAMNLVNRVSLGLDQYNAQLRTIPPDNGYGMFNTELYTDTSAGPWQVKTDPSFTGAQNAAQDEIYYDPGSLERWLGRTFRDIQYTGKPEDAPVYGKFTKLASGELIPYNDTFYGKSFIVKGPFRNQRPVGYVGSEKRLIHNKDGVDVFLPGQDGWTPGDGPLRPTSSLGAPDNPNTNPDWQAPAESDNAAYDGVDSDSDGFIDNATEMGPSKDQGTLSAEEWPDFQNFSNTQKENMELDDISNWVSQG